MSDETNEAAAAEVAEEAIESSTQRAVVVEFDSTALDGFGLLFDTARAVLSRTGVELTPRAEAKWLFNRPAQTGFSALLQSEGKTGGAQLAQTFIEEYGKAVTKQAPGAVTQEFKDFLRAIVSKGAIAVVVTHAETGVLREALQEFTDDELRVLPDDSTVYGNMRRDCWARACRKSALRPPLAVAVTGSGFGARGALQAGMCVVAMPRACTGWQDFSGIDAEIKSFGKESIDEILRILHLA